MTRAPAPRGPRPGTDKTHPKKAYTPPLMPGTKTEHEVIGAVVLAGGELYYMLVPEKNTVSLLPAEVVEGREVRAAKGRKP